MRTLRRYTEPMVLRIANAITRYIGFGEDENITNPSIVDPPPPAPTRAQQRPSLRLMPASPSPEQHPSHRWRRHPQLRAYESPISNQVRDGRHEAVRGLCAARAGALDVAIEHFATAARCEDVDLTAVPGFWNLTRGQMQTAVDAYEAVGRYRDAAALDAHIATIFRPSLVGIQQQPVAPRKQRQAAST